MKKIHITLVQLQAFATVAELSSFTAASEALGMTQSAVSHSLASLEAELGVTLLERDRQGIILTEIGQRVVIRAREILAKTEQIRQEAAAALGLEAGKLRIGSFPSVSAQFLPGLLRQFRQRYPGIELVLFEGTDAEVRDWVISRTIDVGVVTLPEPTLETVPIAQDEYQVVVSSTHPLAERSVIQIKQLAKEPFIMSKAGCKPAIMNLFRKARMTPSVQFEVMDLRTIFAMVKEDIGITIVPQMALPTDLAGLKLLSLTPPVSRSLGFAVSSSSSPPALTIFLQQAEQWAKSQGFLA